MAWMKNSIAYFLAFFIAWNCNAQENCDCEQVLKQLMQKVETEYPGFNDKTKDKIVYSNFKDGLLAKVRDAGESACIGIMRDYKDFFKDGHISIYPVKEDQNGQQNKRADNRVSISPEEFQKHIINTTDPLEGIWTSGTYKVGIIKADGEYKGFIIEADTAFWKPDEIKFRLFLSGKANYYLRDHSLSDESYELVDGWILYFNYSN